MDSDILCPDPKCLLFFIDDTGHEELSGNHIIYGLGGCAVLAADLDHAINSPWRLVREQVNGSNIVPLHASEFSRSATRKQIFAIATFFEQPTFMRLAAVASITTKLPAEMELIYIVLSILGGRMQELADRVTLNGAAVIFEHSQRAKNLIERYFTGFAIVKDGSEVPTELLWMPKSANEPGMEVADFIMHSVHRQERRAIDRTPGFVPDFEAVFMKVPRRLISFHQINGVIGDDPNKMVFGHELR